MLIQLLNPRPSSPLPSTQREQWECCLWPPDTKKFSIPLILHSTTPCTNKDLLHHFFSLILPCVWKETLGKAQVGTSRPLPALHGWADMGFQEGWLCWSSRDVTSVITVALTALGSDQSGAQPERGEQMETQRSKPKSLRRLVPTDRGTCRSAELLPELKEDKLAHSHLEIPQLPHVATSDEHPCETRVVSGSLLLHGSTRFSISTQQTPVMNIESEGSPTPRSTLAAVPSEITRR